jgi:hypothetical protein
MRLVEPNLAVANHAITGELKAGEPELFDEHMATFDRPDGTY